MLGDQLQIIRKELGFTSARGFYQSLCTRARLDFNYSYYMKIEAGQLLPSPKIINQLAGLLSKEHMEKIILSYCASQFPQQQYLFQTGKGQGTVKANLKKSSSAVATNGQQDLTERQVAILAQNREAYYLFLLMALARNGLPKSELTKFFSSTALEDTIKALIQIKLAYLENECLYPSHPDYRFAKAETKSMQTLYKTIDRHNQEKDSFFKLESRRKGFFFKRISPEYIDLITQNLELLFQTIRLANDPDEKNNEITISLNADFSIGKLPG